MFHSFTPYDDNDSVTIVSDFVFEHRKSGDTFNGGNWLTSVGGGGISEERDFQYLNTSTNEVFDITRLLFTSPTLI